ncbi:hypothetical protein GCM10011391_23990 [Pullulanibacillus camelliae]|uniref:YhaN AAA domain-containing protein n=1 Tax=Pullulanibacillus camelliae TaxID=1707096 RepID=A0A8J3DWT4_9BACL|nr:AAA family ATPase [Pullulanibacillus camelliae]GGE44407.1 hypothetical protein GCM10011391_23990 [Pullulanibacillus camelliae]
MKLQSIYIERFGQFRQYQQALADQPFLFIYGPNEAGKSTLMAFIKIILFGFPKRSDMLPYLVGLSERTELGGTLTVEIPKWGTVVIERYRYKNDGRAVIYLPDGQVTDETPLETWLKGYNRDVYESIFSFNLDGLRGIEQLKSDQLNHYLFSTGMMGSANIFDLETTLEKQASELFRPYGKNPSINKLLKRLEGLSKELTLWSKKSEAYNRWQGDLSDSEDQLKRLIDEQQHWERQYGHFLKYKACESLLIDYLNVVKELEETAPAAHFPDKGLQDYENWHTTIVTLEGEQAALAHRLGVIQEKIASLNIDYRFLVNEESIQSLNRERELLQALEPEYQIRLESLRLEQKEYAIQSQKLGATYAGGQLEAIETGLEIKHELKERLNDYERLQQQYRALEVAIEEKENKISQYQATCEHYQQSLLSDQRFEALEAAINQKKNDHQLSQEQKWLEEQIRRTKKQENTIRSMRLLKHLLSGGLLGVLGFVGILLLVSGNLLAGGLLIGAGFAISMFTWLGFRPFEGQSTSQRAEMEDLYRRLEQVKHTLASAPEQKQMEEDYTSEKKRRDQVERVKVQLQEERASYQELITRWDQVEKQRHQAYSKIEEWAAQHHFPMKEEASLLIEVYDLIEDLKERRLRIKHLQSQIDQYRQRFDQFEGHCMTLDQRLKGSGQPLSELINLLTLYKENRGKLDQLADSLQELLEQRQVIEEKLQRYRQECKALFILAGVEDKAAFQHLGRLYEKRQTLLKQKEALWSQLQHVVPQKHIQEQCFKWLESDYWANTEEAILLEKINKLKKASREVQGRIADLRSAIKQMEETTTYAELVHDEAEMREQLKEKAKEWAVLKTAAEWLAKAKEAYRTTRLPKVLKQAGEYMKEMTAGDYVQLFYTEDETFVLKQAKGQSFSLEQLSRGTKEQLYVCLRLALAAIFEAPYQLPLLIDDGFVNFDENRRQQTLKLLSRLAETRQVLFLTCHDSEPIQGMKKLYLHAERKVEDVRFQLSHPSR